MPRKFITPDHKDCSFNSPIILVSPQQVLGLYRQENNSKKTIIDQDVREWYVAEMLKNKWESAVFKGNQCLLSICKI